MDIEKLLEALEAAATQWGMKGIGVLLAVLAGWAAANSVSNRLRRALEARNFDLTLTRFFANLVRYSILVSVGVACLGVFGVQTISFAGLIAAAGLAIGLALQGTLTNFASGVMLLIFRPFKVGDHVKVAGVDGVVEAIDLFTCEFKSSDNRRLIVPNNAIFGATIDNVTHFPERRVDVSISSPYDADLDATRAALEKVAGLVPGVLAEPAPQVFLAGLGGSTVNWQLRLWCAREDYWDVYQATIREAKLQLEGTRIQTTAS
jgi:small conductance mechanosensitive channel